jgi:uncharacterized membrane protein YfcA
MPDAFPDLTLAQMLLVAGTAFVASVIGGMAGYGTGLLLPLALVPIIGAEATVPAIAMTSLFTNASRGWAQRDAINWQHVGLMLPIAAPMAVLAAMFFVRLDGRGATIAIGVVLIALVPLRRVLARIGYRLGTRGLIAGGAVFGFVTGTSTGAGVILISILMASGLTGAAVVATDAVISITIGIVKVITFRSLDALPIALIVFAGLVGCATIPGAFIAKWLIERLSTRVHTALLDGVVLLGGSLLILRALFS